MIKIVQKKATNAKAIHLYTKLCEGIDFQFLFSVFHFVFQ